MQHVPAAVSQWSWARSPGKMRTTQTMTGSSLPMKARHLSGKDDRIAVDSSEAAPVQPDVEGFDVPIREGLEEGRNPDHRAEVVVAVH